MPVAVTGGKYAVATLSSAGTTTVTVSTAPFVSGDFTSKTRLIGLWSSTNTFKGMAWVRRWVSTSSLELQTEFFDPATGSTVIQEIGDKVLVSKDFSESTTTGLTIANVRSVTMADTITFGVAGDQMGVCFYDENKHITQGNFSIRASGGLTVFGKLEDYATNATNGGVSIQSANANIMICDNGSTIFCAYGGRWQSSVSPAYIGCGNSQGTSGHTFILNKVETPNDFVSVNAGDNWTQNATRHQLINCVSATANVNAIMCRWGNGVISGGSYRVLYNSTNPISIFGSDVAGTYNITTPAGQRAVVSDFGGTKVALFRSNTAITVTCNFTNLITRDYRSTYGSANPLLANATGTNKFFFSDTYTNLQSGSIAIVRDNSGATADSILSSGTTWSPSLLRKTCVGATVTENATSWTYGIKKYGFLPVSGTISPSAYNLGQQGTADNVSFGGLVNQIVDTTITLTQAQAAALTEIPTLDNLYDSIVNWGTSNLVRAAIPSLSEYPVKKTDTSLDLGSRSLVVDATAAAVFVGFNAVPANIATIKASVLSSGTKLNSIKTTGTVTVQNGAKINTLVTVSGSNINGSITLSGAQLLGASILILDANQQVIDTQIDYGSSTYTYWTPLNSTGTWTAKVAKYGFVSSTYTFSSTELSSVAVSLSTDLSITQESAATVSAYTTISDVDKFYDYAAYYETTATGIGAARLAAKQGEYVDLGAYNLTFATSGSALSVSGTTITINAGSTFAIGSTFQAGVTTTGSFSTGTTTLTYPALVNSSQGQNYWLNVTIPSGSALYIADNTGATYDYIGTSGTTYSKNIAAGSTGTWTCKVAKYGFNSSSFTFSPAGGGVNVQVVSLATDVSVTDTVANVATYTKLDTLDKLYDYAAYYETTSTGISRSRLLTKAGNSISSTLPVTLTNTGSIFRVLSGSNVLNLNTGILLSGVTFTDGIISSGATTLSSGTQATTAGSYASISGSSVALPGGINYQKVSSTGAITGLPTTGSVSLGGSLTFASANISATGNLVFANTALTGTLTVTTNTATDVSLNSCSGALIPAVSGTGSARFILNGITARDVLPTTMPASTSVAASTLSFAGLIAGSRVVVKQSGVLKDTTLTTGSTEAFATEYVKGDTLTYSIYHPTYQQLHGSITLAEPLINTVTVSQHISNGVESSNVTVKNVNGVTINAGGKVSVDTSAKTITFESHVSLRQALSALQAAWVNVASLYTGNEILPFNLDSVQGIEILNTYTTVNPDTSDGEGWVTVDALAAIDKINYNFVAIGNTTDLKVKLVYDGVDQSIMTVSPLEDKLVLNVSKLPTTILVNSLLKRQDIAFIDRTETVKSGDVWQRFYRNSLSTYVEVVDTAVSVLLPQDTSKYRLVQQSYQPPLDNSNVQHTFDRIIEVEPGTQTRTQVVNQLAAVATFDDYFRAKPYYINSEGKIVIDAGIWLRQRDGTALSGNASGTVVMSSVGNGVYVQPETRLINLSLSDTATESVSYVIFKSSDRSVLVDASGFEVTGTLAPNETKVITIQTSTNLALSVGIVSNLYSEAFSSYTLTSGAINVALTPVLATVVIPAQTQTFDDPATGTLKWKNVINTITFDTTNKDIVIPTETENGQVVKNYNLAYVYFAWRKWILTDVRRMRYGGVIYAEHQLAPAGSVDYSYKFQPGIWFDEGWALNVSSTRSVSDIVQIQASEVARRDPENNSGLVYRSPLANGATTMATVVIAGAATEVIRNAYQQSVTNYLKLNELQGNLGVINTGVKKASLGIPHANNL